MSRPAPMYRVGQSVTITTIGMRIPGYDDRNWSVADGTITQVNDSVAQYSYHVQLTTGVPGLIVHFVGAWQMQAA